MRREAAAALASAAAAHAAALGGAQAEAALGLEAIAELRATKAALKVSGHKRRELHAL
jgi:hypothetical protein